MDTNRGGRGRSVRGRSVRAPVVVLLGLALTSSALPATAALATSPLPPSDQLVIEPTLTFRPDVQWWAPTELPAGWRHGYAVVEPAGQRIRLVGDDGATLDVELRPDSSTMPETGAATERIGEAVWTIVDGGVARVVEGGDQVLAVTGPEQPVRLVAGALAPVPETDLERPPFRPDAEPGPVVLTLPADQVDGSPPFELRAHTDGLYTSVGGDIARVTAEDPLAFGRPVYDPSVDAESVPVVLTGIALDGLAEVMLGLHGGDAVRVTPTMSDVFAESFYAVRIDVPRVLLEQYELGAVANLTRWILTEVDGRQRVYDEPGAEGCVNCPVGPPGVTAPAEPAGPTRGFEPTNTPGAGMWWVPAEVPPGFEFWVAIDRAGSSGDLRTIEYRTGDPESGGIGISIVQSPADGAEVPSGPERLINGVTWSLRGDSSYTELSRIVDGQLLTVSGRVDEPTLTVVAAALAAVPATELERPPFRAADPSGSVVVATVATPDADAVPDDLRGPTELRASTDGVALSLDGDTPAVVWADDPLRLRGGGSRCGADRCVVRLAGVTSPEVTMVEVETLDGRVLTVVPEDRSGRFGVGFFAIEVVVGPSALWDHVVAQVPSILARDGAGNVLAVLTEPI